MALHVHQIDGDANREFLEEGRKDTVTKEPLKAGDRVIFCSVCKSAFLESSWEFIGRSHCRQGDTLNAIPASMGGGRFDRRARRAARATRTRIAQTTPTAQTTTPHLNTPPVTQPAAPAPPAQPQHTVPPAGRTRQTTRPTARQLAPSLPVGWILGPAVLVLAIFLIAVMLWVRRPTEITNNNSVNSNVAQNTNRVVSSGTPKPPPSANTPITAPSPEVGETAEVRNPPPEVNPPSEDTVPTYRGRGTPGGAPAGAGDADTEAHVPAPSPSAAERADSYQRRADQLFQQGEFDAAMRAAEEGLSIDPSNQVLRNLRNRIEAARRILGRKSEVADSRTGAGGAPTGDRQVAEAVPANRKAVMRSRPQLIAQVSGTVWVEVAIDVQGNVVSARAVSGPNELKQAAVSAARQSRFSPAYRDGRPSPDQQTLPFMFSASR